MSDTIDRQAAIEIVDRYDKSHMILKGKPMLGAASIVIELEALPSAQPEREKGKWIWKTGDVYKCSECETETHVDECFEEPIYNYCPYCNAFMDGYER